MSDVPPNTTTDNPGTASATAEPAVGAASAATAAKAQAQNLVNNMMAKVEAPAFDPGTISEDDKNMAFLTYLLAGLTGWVGPLVLYFVKKDASPFLKDQIKETLNWGISLVIAVFAIMIPATILGLIPIIGFFITLIASLGMLAAFIGSIIMSIQLGNKAKTGVAQRYPVNLRLVK